MRSSPLSGVIRTDGTQAGLRISHSASRKARRSSLGENRARGWVGSASFATVRCFMVSAASMRVLVDRDRVDRRIVIAWIGIVIMWIDSMKWLTPIATRWQILAPHRRTRSRRKRKEPAMEHIATVRISAIVNAIVNTEIGSS